MRTGTHHLDGDGQASLPGVARPLRSGRRLGRTGMFVEVLTVDKLGSADIGGCGFFLGKKGSKMDILPYWGGYHRSPSASLFIETNPLQSMLRRGHWTLVVLVKAMRRGSQVVRSIIGRVAIYVIDQHGDLRQIDSSSKSPHCSMKKDVSVLDLQIPVVGLLWPFLEISGNFTGELSVPSPSYLLTREVMSWPYAPTKNSILDVHVETL